MKGSTQAGEVQLHKIVHETQEQVPVTLQHEEVYIERHTVDGPTNAGGLDGVRDETISVPVYEERAELQKQTRIHEEVGISKQAVEQQQTLSGTTRHEELEITQSGDAQVVGDKTANTAASTANVPSTGAMQQNTASNNPS